MDTRLNAIYRDIQRQRDESLVQILRVLIPKAVKDAEIAVVVKQLQAWMPEYPREHLRPGEKADDAPDAAPRDVADERTA